MFVPILEFYSTTCIDEISIGSDNIIWCKGKYEKIYNNWYKLIFFDTFVPLHLMCFTHITLYKTSITLWPKLYTLVTYKFEYCINNNYKIPIKIDINKIAYIYIINNTGYYSKYILTNYDNLPTYKQCDYNKITNKWHFLTQNEFDRWYTMNNKFNNNILSLPNFI